MSTGLIVTIVLSLVSLLVCAGGGFLLFCLVLGLILLRRRGKEKVTATEALGAGVESVSMVFRRGADGDLQAVTGAGEDDEEG